MVPFYPVNNTLKFTVITTTTYRENLRGVLTVKTVNVNYNTTYFAMEKFYHPYKPYKIQLELMNVINDSLNQDKKLVILESPTGTGKTLSLICSTLTWLRGNKWSILKNNFNDSGTKSKQNLNENNNSDSDDSSAFSDDEDEPDWVIEQSKNNFDILFDKLHILNEYENFLNNWDDKVVNLNTNDSLNSNDFKKKRTKTSKIEIKIEDDEFLPKPYNDNDNADEIDINNIESKKELLSNDIKNLLAKINDTSKCSKQSDDIDRFQAINDLNPVKVFFASRTHSQLIQFAHQLKLPDFPSSFENVENDNKVLQERIKFLSLGSKKQLCINPDVRKWKTLEAINDACYEKRHSKEGCPFYNINQDRDNNNASSNHSTSWNNKVKKFNNLTNRDILDIEDLYKIGTENNACPYYASRDTIPNMEVVTLPYQYLLSESTRDSLKINLKDAIVIIDEAHNLIDTINNIYSSTISLSDLNSCYLGLNNYLNKFKLRLNPGNRVNLLKLLKLIKVIINFINRDFKKPGQKININDIFNSTNLDTINIHKLVNYIKKSKIAYKIDAFIKSLDENENMNANIENKEDNNAKSQPLLFKMVSFMNSLTNPEKEGQFFFDKGPLIKYMLLDPSKHFETLINNSKCIILAGGTMEPMNDFKKFLFPELNEDHIVKFSCNHIIPDSNLNTFIINDPMIQFNYSNRNNLSLINESLFGFFWKLVDNIPQDGGIVGFFPSYSFLQDIINHWKANKLFQKLNNRRKIFYESKNGTDPLEDYTESVSKGAILFAVVGGKLSEGINFQDNLCRAVVMTGLPFPNLNSGELQIKINYLKERAKLSGEDPEKASKQFIENICMKAVNQSVGRAIRHINDYANIYLLDNRYDREEIRDKLSLWVRKRIQPQTKIDSIMKQTNAFFQYKKEVN